jgi:hypothetical protein
VRFEHSLHSEEVILQYISQDRENESRFGATPVPGKIGMAMAGQGLNAAPPPRPPSHNHFGSHANPGNQLYVGNVRFLTSIVVYATLIHFHSYPTRPVGRISRTSSAPLGISFVQTSILVPMADPKALVPWSSKPPRMPNKQSVRPYVLCFFVFIPFNIMQVCIMVSIGTVGPLRSERFVLCSFHLNSTSSMSQDRFAGLGGLGGFRGGGGGFRGGLRGFGGGRGFRGGGFRGGFRGGFAGQAGAGRDFSNQDLYADYSGPDQQAAPGGGLRMDSYGGGGYAGHGGHGGHGGGYGGNSYTEPEPSQQIMVRNVCDIAICLSSPHTNHTLSYRGQQPMRI